MCDCISMIIQLIQCFSFTRIRVPSIHELNFIYLEVLGGKVKKMKKEKTSQFTSHGNL